MSYPALVSFFADPERTPARAAVYMAIQPPILSHTVPRDLKLDVVHRAARVSRGQASKALAWLIAHGYLVLHSRDTRGMPSLSLAWAVEVPQVPTGNRLAG